MIATADCYVCLGTGTTVGFVHVPTVCPCVDHCEDCEAPIDWAKDDERAPRLCTDCAVLS